MGSKDSEVSFRSTWLVSAMMAAGLEYGAERDERSQHGDEERDVGLPMKRQNAVGTASPGVASESAQLARKMSAMGSRMAARCANGTGWRG